MAVFYFAKKQRDYKMSASIQAIQTVSDNSFEADVLNAPIPVLVDFWAEWCAPCKMIAPILNELAGSYTNRIKIVKLNIDENREIPVKYGIRSIPTLLLFKDHQPPHVIKVGLASKLELVALLDQYL